MSPGAPESRYSNKRGSITNHGGVMGTRNAVALIALLVPGATLAAQTSTSIGLRLGTLGIGVEANRLLSDHVGVRVSGNYFSLSRNAMKEDVTYDATFKLQAVTGLVDLYPSKRGAFHLTAGAATNPLKFSGIGQSNGGGN